MKSGFTPSEWQQIVNQQRSYLQNAVITITPLTGLSANALAHLRREWIEWRDDTVRVSVPKRASCNSFKSRSPETPERLPQIVERSNPCGYCRKKGSTDQFENLNSSPTRPAISRVDIVVHREIARPAVEFLERVFRTYERPELAVTPTSVYEAANAVVEGDLSETYSYGKLRRTAPVIYAQYGLSPEDVSEITTYPSSSAKQIVHRTSGVNWAQQSTQSFLRAIAANEPVTINELVDKLNCSSRGSVHARLTHLREEGRVTVSNNSPGRPAATWETAESWNSPFECNYCEFKTHSLGGIRTHREVKHGK